MKVVVVGDLHLKQDTLDIFEKLMKEITTYKYPIIFLGDIFHSKHKVTIPFVLEVMNIFLKYPDIEITIVDGNHDLLSDDLSINALFDPPIKVYTKHEIVDFHGVKTCFYPYRPTEKIDVNTKYSCQLVFSHLFLEGSSYKYVGIKEVPLHIFDANLIFNGHIHSPSVYKNVVFTGNIYPTNYTERNDRHFYYILDTDTMSYESVEVAYIQMVETNEYNPVYNTPEYTIYFTGDTAEANKYTNVRKLILRNVVKLEEIKEKEQDVSDMYVKIKAELIDYLKKYSDVADNKIENILKLLPPELYFKLYNNKNGNVLDYLKKNVLDYETFVGGFHV